MGQEQRSVRMADNETQNAVKRMAEFTALLYYHLTKAFVDEYGQEAKKVIKKAIREFGLERGRNIARKVVEANQEPTIANLDKYYDMPISQGWAPAADYEGQEKHSKTLSCTFANVWLEKSWEEIGQIYCQVDPAIREGYNSDIDYIPEKNILKGDPFCSSTTRYKNK